MECFIKAVATDQAEGAETLKRMGQRYVAEAAALDRSFRVRDVVPVLRGLNPEIRSLV